MAKKKNNTGLAILLAAVIVVGSFVVTNGFTKNPISGASLVIAPPAPPLSGAGAWCPGSNTVYTTPFSNLPSNCLNVLETLQITPQAWNPGTGSPMGVFKASNVVVCKIFQLQSSGWVNTETILASTSGICTSANSYLPGSQITVEFCENTVNTCATGQYTTTSTIMYCALPSVSGNGLCGSGPGAGYVPLWTPSGSTTIQYSYYMPIMASSGDQYQGMNAANKQSLAWTWQNGTQITTTAAVCFVKSGSANCDLPTASSVGRFSALLTIQPFGTFPAAPYAFGYSSFSQVDPSLQTGTVARGPLNYVLAVEIKATTNTDTCTVTNGGTVPFTTSAGIVSITPTILSKGGSGTDTLYLYVIPDSAVVRATDASGNPVPGFSGTLTGSFFFDCNQVYNGSGDVVGIAATQWSYLSTKYVAAYNGNSVNPEAVKVGGAADSTATFGTVTNGLQIKT